MAGGRDEAVAFWGKSESLMIIRGFLEMDVRAEETARTVVYVRVAPA